VDVAHWQLALQITFKEYLSFELPVGVLQVRNNAGICFKVTQGGMGSGQDVDEST
jgi:hypothetical protein